VNERIEDEADLGEAGFSEFNYSPERMQAMAGQLQE
jgi:hypothetical protein